METYLRKFKEKHLFSDEDCKRYSDSDIMFDVEMEMPEDALEQWEEYTKKNGYISFAKWTGVDNGYTPKDIDRSGMDDLKSELNGIYKEIERTFDTAFASFYEDDDSDSDDSDFYLLENYLEDNDE